MLDDDHEQSSQDVSGDRIRCSAGNRGKEELRRQ